MQLYKSNYSDMTLQTLYLLFRIDDVKHGLLNGFFLELPYSQVEFADQTMAAALIMVIDLDSTAII